MSLHRWNVMSLHARMSLCCFDRADMYTVTVCHKEQAKISNTAHTYTHIAIAIG